MKELTSKTLERLYSLEGKTGIVTGASRGIGREIACLLADAGALIFDLSRTAAEDPAHENVIRKQVDITDFEALKKVIDEIGENSGIDFLINNAGITKRVKAQDVDNVWWEKIHRLNVDALFFASQYAYPYLKKSETAGRIVNISSMAAYMGFSEVVPYCSTKSSVTGITRGLATEWAGDNILVNSVSPGWFQSDMNKQVVDEKRKEMILNKVALNRYGDLKEISYMVLFLVSNASSYITGQDFSVDGGARSHGY